MILEAATRVLTREGRAALNTNRVAEVAGVSVGSLYQYFPSKEAILAALVAQARAERLRALGAQVTELTGRPLMEALRALAAAAAQQQAGPLASLLDEEERRLPLTEEAHADLEALAQHVARLLDDHRAELSADLPLAAARDVVVLVRALVDADAERSSPAADLEARVLRALVGYLLPASPRS